ncbi:MAG: hypothetical protein U0944_00735 [Candidatus Moranbacteria bacterium]|nr:hypothetical protein [Candidatus Moranbacteria bacterium]
MLGLSVHSVNISCGNEDCDALQVVPLVKDSRGYYHTPRRHMCRACGKFFLISGSLCVYEVKPAIVNQPQETRHIRVGYNAEAVIMCHSEGTPDLMEIEPPDEIGGEYNGIRRRLLGSICG